MASDYSRIALCLEYLVGHFREQPSLAQLADLVGLSPWHFQRLFVWLVGISPKRFVQFLNAQEARHRLDTGESVLEAALGSGLSGPGRLHDLLVRLEAATPGEYQRAGAGWTVSYDWVDSPFGSCLLAVREGGVCGLHFPADEERNESLRAMRRQWPVAEWRQDPATVARWVELVFPQKIDPGGRPPLSVLVRGTPFQVRVWEALLRIPPGHTATYGEVARAAGRPRAVRAAASAVGDNPVAWLIPCHRVIRASGALGGYRWGLPRKRLFMAWERGGGRAPEGCARADGDGCGVGARS